MRAIIFLALVVLLMGLAGWLTFGRSPGQATINIETDEIRRDTESALEKTEQVIESGARAITGDDRIDEQRSTTPIQAEPYSEPELITAPVAP